MFPERSSDMPSGKTKQKKFVIRTVENLVDAPKEAMTNWIGKSPKLGGKLKKMGYTDWDVWRAFQTMNKDFLSVIIKAAM